MIVNLVGRMSECVMLAYRTPAESVRALVPPGLELMTRGPWAYWSVLACRVEGMALAGLPGTGWTFHGLAYRLHVQAMTDRIDVLTGVYVVRSESDSRLIAAMGNVLADLRLHPSAMTVRSEADCVVVTSESSGQSPARLVIADRPSPPESSPVESSFPLPWRAEAWLAYPTRSLSVQGRDVRCVEVYREAESCVARPVTVVEAALPYLASLGQRELALELAVRLPPGRERWRIGSLRRLLQPGVRGVMDGRGEVRRRRGAVVIPSRPEPVSV